MTDPETTSTIRKVLQGITYSVGAGFLYAGYRRQVELKTLRKAPIVVCSTPYIPCNALLRLTV